MDDKTIDQLKDLLKSRWEQIGQHAQRGSKERLDEMAESAAPHAEIIDIAQALEQLGRDSSLQEAERRELLAIERALSKLATGTFGYCEDCGDEIPPKRLMIVPEARLCANCQAFEERQTARTRQRVAGR